MADTPARHVYTGNGNIRVFPIPTRIIGDDYVRIEIDGIHLIDRTQWDIVNNSVIFLTAPINGSEINIQVATSEEALSVLGSVTNVDIVAENIEDINSVANSIISVNTTATNIASINTVSGNTTNINTVSSNIDNINEVVTNLDEIVEANNNSLNITTVADSIVKVGIVADNILDVNNVVDNITDINTISNSILNVINVSDNIASVTTVSNDSTEINTLASIHTQLESLYADRTKLTSLYNDKTTLDSIYSDKAKLDAIFSDLNAIEGLYGIKAKLESIYADKSKLDSIYADKSKLDSIYADKTQLDTLYNNISNILTVYSSIASVITVSNNIASVSTTASNIVDVNTFSSKYKISSTQPSSHTAGDLWYDTIETVLKYYNGSSYVAVTPDINLLLTNTKFISNISIGNTTLSGWTNSFSVIEAPGGTFFASDGIAILTGSNCYYDGVNWKYKVDGTAGLQLVNKGNYTFKVAISGTAGSNITWVTIASISDSSTILPSNTSIGNVSSTELQYLDGVTSSVQNQIDTKAPLVSPVFTGTPSLPSGTTAVTQTAGDNSTKIATTAFVLANTLFTAGTNVEAQATAEVSSASTTYTKKKEISVSTGGTITVSFRLRASISPYAAYGQIYVNGVAVGTVRTTSSQTYVTYTQNITVAAGALVQLYIKCGGTDAEYPAMADQFKILVAAPSTSTVFLN